MPQLVFSQWHCMLKAFTKCSNLSGTGPISWSTEQDCVDTVWDMQAFQIFRLLYIVQCNLNCTTQTVAPLIEVLLTTKKLHGQHLIDRIAGCYLVVLPVCCSSHLVHTAASSDRYFAAKPTILVMTHIYRQMPRHTGSFVKQLYCRKSSSTQQRQPKLSGKLVRRLLERFNITWTISKSYPSFCLSDLRPISLYIPLPSHLSIIHTPVCPSAYLRAEQPLHLQGCSPIPAIAQDRPSAAGSCTTRNNSIHSRYPTVGQGITGRVPEIKFKRLEHKCFLNHFISYKCSHSVSHANWLRVSTTATTTLSIANHIRHEQCKCSRSDM